MSDLIISLEKVSLNYNNEINSGIRDIDLSIRKGEFVSIVGESGSGKSTLLKIIYGLLSPDKGEVYFKGLHLEGPSEKLIPGHESMKMLSQDFNLNLYARVYENIESMLSNDDLSGKKQRATDMMKLLGIEHLAQKKIVELSGGEQQRVALARAVITKPEVLLLDEPFSQLDAMLKTQFRKDLKHLCKNLGITIILVSHDSVDGLTLADRMIILKGGQIIESGRPEDIYANPSHAYTAKLLGNAFTLSAEEARLLGIKSRMNTVMIYPEWVQLTSGWTGKKYLVREVFFKGFYEDVLLERKNIQLIAINYKPGIYHKGDQVQVRILRYLEFE